MPVQVRPAVPEAASGDNRPFWAIFLCKENSPQKWRYRGFIAFQASCFLRALQPPLFSSSLAQKGNERDQYYAEEIHKTSEHKITSLERCFTHDQGLLSPFDKSRKLSIIIQLIVRNVKRIFIRSYILQIAVLIAASGAFGDQIK